MVNGKQGARRDGVFSAARALVHEELELFVAAGQQLDEIYSEELVREDDFPLGPGEKYAAEETPEGVRLKRLGVAAKCFRFPESHPYDNHFDFEGIGPIEDRKQAARMGILVMLAAADPDKGEVITPAMGVLANTPFEIEGEGRLPGIRGSHWLSWNETGWDDYNEPSPRVLKRLREAIDIVRHGSLDAVRKSRIPSGDGRPCDKPGLNPFDEAHRSLYDIIRHVSVFRENSTQWLQTQLLCVEPERQETLDWLIEYTRDWWATWTKLVSRTRDALTGLELKELEELVSDALGGVARLHVIFQEPVFYMDHEQPGDHLFRPMGVLGCRRDNDRYPISNYPRDQIDEALKPIGLLIERLSIYIDGSVVVEQPVVKKPKRKRSRSEIAHDEIKLALYLDENPRSNREEAAEYMGLSEGTISGSRAWKNHTKKKREAQQEARPSQFDNFDSLADPDSANIRSADGGKASSHRSISASNARRQ